MIDGVGWPPLPSGELEFQCWNLADCEETEESRIQTQIWERKRDIEI